MKEAFIFLIMARTLQFFIENQGSKRYVKGFIGIITLVIITQSLLHIKNKSESLQDYFADILKYDLTISNQLDEPEELKRQREEDSEQRIITNKDVSVQIQIPDIIVQEISIP